MLRLSRKGTHIIIIPGNHDIVLREWIKEITPFFFGDIVLLEEFEYMSLHCKKFLLFHGDKYDGIIHYLPWLYWIGDKTYELIIKINTLYNKITRLFGIDYWSLSSYLKSKVKETAQIINKFDSLVVEECIHKNYDGIIYGHTHTPYIKTIKDKIIMNDGDVCENITCIVETLNGRFQLIKLTDNSILKEL
jgi:UDP-2,3-diacylglucosamine pyrophosphatase LpxH